MEQTSKNIAALQKILTDFDIKINVNNEIYLDEYKNVKAVELVMQNESFNLFIDDEYDDFVYKNPILNLCIVLRELEDYKFSNDYLIWCAERHIKPQNETARQFYMGLDKIYFEIKLILGEINSFIPSMDFEFDMGEVRILRHSSN